MTWRGTDNLAAYLKDAVLPEMRFGPDAPERPPAGHKSHRNTLSVRSQPYRQLHTIHQLDAAFDKLVVAWMGKYTPSTSLCLQDEDEASGENLSIPSARKFKIPRISLQPVSDFQRVYMWLDRFPFQTVQRVFHIMFPETSQWGFVTGGQKDPDNRIFKDLFWTSTRAESTPEIRRRSVVVMYQPPWILSTDDIWNFMELKSLPFSGTSLRSKERLWGKIWDLCVRQGCPWFVLTTYQNWIFGTFTEGWTTAYVSPVFNSSSRDPTVAHALIYWIGSAFGLPEGFQHPEIPEPIDNLSSEFTIPQAINERIFVEPSESSWTGDSQEAASSAGAAEVVPLDVSDVESDGGMTYRPLDVRRTYNPRRALEFVEKWRSGLPSDKLHSAQLDSSSERESSPTPSLSLLFDDADSDSGSTSGSSTDVEIGGAIGHWLSSAPRKNLWSD